MDLRIQQYLKDEQIPFQNRKNFAVDFDTKQIDERVALQMLDTKYPGRYGVPNVQPSQSPVPSQPVSQPPSDLIASKGFIPTAQGAAQVAPQIQPKKVDGFATFHPALAADKEAKTVKAPTLQDSITMVQSYANVDKLADKYNWDDRTKRAFLFMEPTEQRNMLDASDADSWFGQVKAGAKDAAGNLAGLMYEHTVEPMLEHTAAVAKGAQALPSLFGALSAYQAGDKAKAQELMKESDRIWAEEVKLFGKNWNPMTQAYDEDFGEFDEGKLQKALFAVQAKGTGGAINTATLTAGYPLAGSFWRNFIAGALMGSGKDLAADKSVPEAIIDGAVAGFIQGVIGKVGGLAHKATTKSAIDKSLMKKKVTEDVRAIFKDSPENQKIAVEYLDDAIHHLKNKTKNPTVWAKPAKEIDDFVIQLGKLKSQIGKQVGATKETLKGIKIDPKPILKPINDFIKSVGAETRTAGKYQVIDWSRSDLKGAGSATKIIDDIFIAAQRKTLDARAAEAFTAQIDQFSGLLKTTGIRPSTVNTALSQIKRAINETVEPYSASFSAANKDYAIVINAYNQIKQAMKVGSGKNVSFDATQMLVRLMNRNGLQKYGNVFETMRQIGGQYKLKVPANIESKAWIAYWAESVTGGAPARATEQVMASEGAKTVGQMIGGTAGKAVRAAGAVARKVMPKSETPIADYAGALKSIFENALKAGKSKTLGIPSEQIYKALALIANIERVAQNPLKPPTLSGALEKTFGEPSPPESYQIETPYITKEWIE